MKVKICGIKTMEAAEHVVEAGADFIGFVFARSKRKISKEKAAEIAAALPSHVKTVGVFVNETKENIIDIAETVGLDYIQLHGDESPEFCQEMPRPVIKAFQVTSKEDLNRLTDYPSDYFLLDSPAGKYRGGNGETFDWSLAKDMPNLAGKIILAGGLHADNVGKALAEVKPAGVDVSSGVETDGEKDPLKVTAFIQAAKRREENK